MINKNTMGKVEYVLTNAWYVFLAMIWYKGLFFIGLQDHTVNESKWILRLMVISFVVFGIFCTFEKRRNNVSIMVNTLLPYEIYAMISYWPYQHKFIVGVLVFAMILLTAYFCLILFQKVKKRAPLKKIYMNRLKFATLGCRTLFAVCLLVFVIPIGLRSAFGVQLYKTSTPSVKSFEVADEWTVKNNIKVVKLLQEDEWQKLNTQEKLDVLGVITNIEIRYLGINHEVYLSADILEENTLACYDDRNHEVVIDLDHLNNSSVYDVLHSHLHEMYHVYQHVQVEVLDYIPEEYRQLRMFNSPKQYAEEFDDYIDGNDDYWGYALQSVELTADTYAYDAVQEYYELIEEYTVND